MPDMGSVCRGTTGVRASATKAPRGFRGCGRPLHHQVRPGCGRTGQGGGSAAIIYNNASGGFLGVIDTTANDGAYTWSSNNRGSATYTFQVCEAGAGTCSDSVNVFF